MMTVKERKLPQGLDLQSMREIDKTSTHVRYLVLENVDKKKKRLVLKLSTANVFYHDMKIKLPIRFAFFAQHVRTSDSETF